MSESQTLPPRTHNNPPIAIPKDTDVLVDLKGRYPEVQTLLDQYEKSLLGFPKKLGLEDEEVAAALQDLLGNMAKQKRVWSAHKKEEKSTWDKMVKVVQNFFGKAEEKVDAYLEEWRPVHTAFLDLQEAANRRKAEEEAERQRKAAEESRLAAEKAAEEQRRAEAAAAEARRKEEEARLAAEKAEQERVESLERQRVAAEEEKRLAEEKKKRDREEKARNEDGLRSLKRYMKDAEKLHLLAEADEANEAEVAQLDQLIKSGGIIGLQASPIAASTLLDDEQRAEIEGIRKRVGEMRTAMDARFSKREQKRREKERAEEEKRQAELAEMRRLEREEAEGKLAAAKAAREEEERKATAAKEEQKKAEAAARTARTEARGHAADAKDAAKEVKDHGTDADRAGNRADRLDRRIESGAADGGPLRGELGTVGSKTGRWARFITDEAALRASLGPLGPHFTEAALEGATYQWMAAHRSGWTGERIEGALPGVTFIWEEESRIA